MEVLLRGPEADGRCKDAMQCLGRVGELERRPDPRAFAPSCKELTDRIDQAHPGSEVQMQRRTSDACPGGNLLDRRLVEPPLGEQIADGLRERLARLCGPP